METIQTNALMTDRKINIPLTAKVKDAILHNQVKIGAAAGLIAGTIFVSGRYFSPILEKEPAPVAKNPPVTDEHVAQNPGTYVSASADTKVIPTADNAGSFEEAFDQQRTSQGPGGIFEYQGKTYNTFFKEEWESMSTQQKQNYYAEVNEKLDPNDCKILVSDDQGNVATLSFDEQQIMKLEVLDENNDGIMDIASIDINFDGVADYTFPIESVVVPPDSTIGDQTQNIIIDDNSYNPDFENDYEQVDPSNIIIDDNSYNPDFENDYEQVDQHDLTLIKDNNIPSMEDQNIFNDDALNNTELPDIIDDIDMDEFNNL